jgi:hypothetical protein
MAGKHPYISGSGPVVQVIEHLRKSFPAALTAETLKKLGIAPNNETYLINILRFLGVIDEGGAKTAAAGKIFSLHGDSDFQEAFAKLVKGAYADLFALHGDSAWGIDRDKLISYFRTADESSALVGRRQATTFQALAGLAGHGEVPPAKKTGAIAASGKAGKKKAKKDVMPAPNAPPLVPSTGSQTQAARASSLGLTVRIEVNLPADGDQATYDRIFRSLRENLIDVK